MERHLHPVAIMIEVTTRHMECTPFNLYYSRMPVVALHYHFDAGIPSVLKMQCTTQRVLQ